MALVGCGSALPNLSLSNDQLSHRVETNDAWIRSRTGHRRPAGRWPGETLTQAWLPTRGGRLWPMRAGSLRISI